MTELEQDLSVINDDDLVIKDRPPSGAPVMEELGNVDAGLLARNADSGGDSEEAERWKQIRRYQRLASVQVSRIIGVEMTENRQHVHLITSFDGFTVVIPDNQYFTENFQFSREYAEKNDLEKTEERYRTASYQIGARVSFVFVGAEREKNPDESCTYTIIGSRTQALKKLQDYYFHSKKSNHPKIEKGSVVTAHVLSVREDSVRVECCGIESIVSAYELYATKYVENCHEVISVGDDLIACVKKFHLNEDGSVYLSVSPRQYEMRDAPKYLRSVKEGGIYLGTIIAYNKESKVYTVGLDCRVIAAIPPGSVQGGIRLFIGDRVTVKVTAKLAEFVRGTALKI